MRLELTTNTPGWIKFTLCAMGLLLLLLGVGALIWKSSKNTKKQDPNEEAPLSQLMGNQNLGQIQLSDEKIATQADKLNLGRTAVKKFLTSKSLEERMRLVREGAKHQEAIQQYLAQQPVLNYALKGPFLQMDDGNGALRFIASSGSNSRVINVDIETSLIDWEAFAGTNIAPFDTLQDLATTKAGAPIRCFLENGPKIDYFNYGYDRENWRCFRLTLPDDPNYLWAYLEKGSKLDIEITSLLRNEKNRAPMILWIRRLDDSPKSRQQVQITGLGSHTWRLPQYSKISEYYQAKTLPAPQ